MTAERFAARLRELRAEAGWTQDQLAEKTGVKRGAIARWELGTREPTWCNVVSLAEALGVGTDAFRQKPAASPGPQRGRPRKEFTALPAPKRPRGRPGKGDVRGDEGT
jgi:transcriptional regulator with XRE-family HTH domain